MGQNPMNFIGRQHMLRSDFEVFHYSDPGPRHVEPHRHSFYELLFFAEGDVTYMVEDTSCPLQPGDLLIIPSQTLHYPVFRGNSRYRRVVLWLTMEFVRSLPQGEELARIFEEGEQNAQSPRLLRLSSSNSSRLLECAMELAEESSYDRPFSSTMSTLLVARLLILLHRMLPASLDHGQGNCAAQRLVDEVVGFINHNLSLDLTLDYLADHFFISKFYLSRVFKKHMNVSPHSYISQRRLFLAKQLLYNGLPPTEVYRRCGYRDYSSFFRAFKEKYGFSPRQACLKNDHL